MADPKQPYKPEPHQPQQPGGRPGDEQRERQKPRPEPQKRAPEPGEERKGLPDHQQ